MGLQSYNSWDNETVEEPLPPKPEPEIIYYNPDDKVTEGFPWHVFRSNRYAAAYSCLEHAIRSRPNANIDRESYYRWEAEIDRLIKDKLV